MSSGSDEAVKEMRQAKLVEMSATRIGSDVITKRPSLEPAPMTVSSESKRWGALERQEGGTHYKNLPIQPIEYTMKNKLGFCIGNVVKYATRAGHLNKVKALEDLRKARHYLELEAELVYGEKL